MNSFDVREFEDLINKDLQTIKIEGRTLSFLLKDGTVIDFDVHGDCCSRSYIEDIDNPEIFQDATFLSVETVSGHEELIDPDEDGYSSEVHKWTFYKFKTTKGMCTLSFRNESNGYYNGYLVRLDND